jgi:hypothetical protein
MTPQQTQDIISRFSEGELCFCLSKTIIWNSGSWAEDSEIGTVKADSPLIFLGETEEGFLWCLTAFGVGWVHVSRVFKAQH